MAHRSARAGRTRRLAAAAAVAAVAAGAAVGIAGLVGSPSALADPAAPASPSGPTPAAALPGPAAVPSAARHTLPARGTDGVPTRGRYAFLLQLDTASTATAYRSAAPRGRSIATGAARSQLADIRQRQAAVVAALPAATRVLYRTHAVLPGLAVDTDVSSIAALGRIAGVSAVYPIALKRPSLGYAVPLQKAPQAWTNYGDTGQHATIAIIDSGIDYTHADFGGPGTNAAYTTAHAAEDAPADPDLFPTSKILGGHDFAGDSYDPDPSSDSYQPVPQPDANPLDCGGHGTHVAGIAAGEGVNSDGTTYTGSYDTGTPFDSLRIGPGMAPAARLYAFKVFGCDGGTGTDLISAAIDAATDPNGDGDPSDHVDVINLSVGADFTSPRDGDAIASNDASALGVTVVAAAGNAGDVYDAVGSPGSAARALTVASSVDAFARLDALHVTAPSALAGNIGVIRAATYAWGTKPDLAGTVVRLSQAGNRDGCGPLNAADTAAVRGRIVFFDYDSSGGGRCTISARANAAKVAGATGYILGANSDDLGTPSPSTTLPGVLAPKASADRIRAQLAAGHTVTVSGTAPNAVSRLRPQDDDRLDDFSSRGTRGAGDVKPDVTAVGDTVFSAAVGTGSGGVTDSGTSMAAPMVAGLAALVVSRHPDWTPEQVKADIMNTAGQDVFTGGNHTGATYAPNRVGAGRIDALAAVGNTVLAYSQDNPGAVSVSFGSFAVTSPTTLSKRIRVVNKGLSSVTYAVSYDPATAMPGATWSVSPASVTMAPRSSATVTVTLTLRPGRLTKTIDPTVSRTQLGLPRDYVADTSGRVLLTRSGHPQLRVPVYAAPRPASSTTQSGRLTMPAGPVQTKTLVLDGHGLDQGSGATRIRSVVAGFELQARSGRAPVCSNRITQRCVSISDERSADLRYVGITSDAPQVTSAHRRPLVAGRAYIAITTQGAWTTPTDQQFFYVYIDSTGDGVPDVVAINERLLDGTGADTDVFVSDLYNVRSGELIDSQLLDNRAGDVDTALFDSDTMVMPVALADLPGLRTTRSRISYGVVAYSAYQDLPIDVVGFNAPGTRLDASLTLDVLRPGIAVFGKYVSGANPLLYTDRSGVALHVRRDIRRYRADHALGVEIVHFHDVVGSKAQIVSLANTRVPSTVRLRPAATTIRHGRRLSVTISVDTSAGTPATGTVLLRQLTPTRTVRAQVRLVNGRATVTLVFPAAGSKVLQASYRGDADYRPATSIKHTVTAT